MATSATTGTTGHAAPRRAAPPPHAATNASTNTSTDEGRRIITIEWYAGAAETLRQHRTPQLCKLSHMTSTAETPDLRYPIGKRVPPTSFTAESRAAALTTIADTLRIFAAP